MTVIPLVAVCGSADSREIAFTIEGISSTMANKERC